MGDAPAHHTRGPAADDHAPGLRAACARRSYRPDGPRRTRACAATLGTHGFHFPHDRAHTRVRGYARGTAPLLILPHSPSSRPRLVGTDGASPCPPPRLWHPRTARGVVCARRRQDKGACTGRPFPTPALAATGTPTPAHRPRRQVHGSGVSLGAMRVPHNPHTPATLLYRVVCYPARLVRHCKGLSGWMSTPSM